MLITQDWYKEWHKRMWEIYNSEWDRFLRELRSRCREDVHRSTKAGRGGTGFRGLHDGAASR